MLIVPPGSGIIHQVNLEYLARVVFIGDDNLLYPDSLVGTDSHTTMINGLGVVGWGKHLIILFINCHRFFTIMIIFYNFVKILKYSVLPYLFNLILQFKVNL